MWASTTSVVRFTIHRIEVTLSNALYCQVDLILWYIVALFTFVLD